MVEAHNSEVILKSNANQGTMFSFKLPKPAPKTPQQVEIGSTENTY